MKSPESLELEALLRGEHANPHHFLGIHKVGQRYVVRGIFVNAKQCFICKLSGEVLAKMHKIAETMYEAFLPAFVQYQFKVVYGEHEERFVRDPYVFSPTLTAEDLYLFNQGNHHRIYRKMGSHLTTHESVEGCSFAVWAPNACRVSVVGDFNQWDGRCAPMRRLENSGVWELFIPGLTAGLKYKYEIYDANRQIQLKSDPYGTYFEGAPNNASIICPRDEFLWEDAAWLKSRASENVQEKAISIYEVHLDSWRHDSDNRPLSYRELADQLVDYVSEMNFSHVEFLPVAEHPFLGSWGYQVTGFFAPTSRYGTPEDFMFLVNAFHKRGIGVIIDWVPGHFPKDSFALAKFDGTALYEHADPRQGEHQDWGTLIFNYGRHEVNNFLVSNALSWLDRFHVDGLRVDAVASMLYLDYSRKEGEWIPNRYGGKENLEAIDFLRRFNDLVHAYYPGVMTIAEESTAFGRVSQATCNDGLGFDFKWNMGWMHDSLNYCKQDPVFRQYHHNEMTFGMLYQYSEHFMSVFSHDEVVHGKGSMVNKMGSYFFDDKLSTLKTLYAYMWGWPGKKTLFMGNEFAQVNEWDYHKELDWHLLKEDRHKGVQTLLRDLNALYKTYPFLSRYDMDQRGFAWTEVDDYQNSVFAFIRRDGNTSDTLLFVSNFTPVERRCYQVGVPFQGVWREILNTDARYYAVRNRGNSGQVSTRQLAYHAYPYTLELYLPPLSTLIFAYSGE